MTENVLQEADRLTSGDRQQAYSHPSVNFARIARLWRAHLGCRYGGKIQLDAEDVAWMMVQVKQARDIATPKRDNLVDAAGYVRTLEMARAIDNMDGYAP
jgi:hypothetical protein